jgi:hypothetical protein
MALAVLFMMLVHSTSIMASHSLVHSSLATNQLLLNVSFRNAPMPSLPPNVSSAFDSTVCMNPFILRVDDEWRLYYAGADNKSVHRIALATAPVKGPTPKDAQWVRRGVVLDHGAPDTFNSIWSVLPLVHKFGSTWHLYFTGRSTSCPYTNKTGLQTFWGVGLATSADGIHFTARKEPVMLGNETPQYPNNYGIAGGGSIVEDRQADGSVLYRQYYTLAVGSTSPDVKVDQKKVCAVAHSTDGIRWFNHSVVMGPVATDANDREDVACAAPVVWQDSTGGRSVYRMVYSAIGTRWGYYSLAQAVSADGYSWYRGRGFTHADDDLILGPTNSSVHTTASSVHTTASSVGATASSVGATADTPATNRSMDAAAALSDSWDSQMVEYAALWRGEEGRLGLFYAGNGYGRSGIGYTESAIYPARYTLLDDSTRSSQTTRQWPPSH